MSNFMSLNCSDIEVLNDLNLSNYTISLDYSDFTKINNYDFSSFEDGCSFCLDFSKINCMDNDMMDLQKLLSQLGLDVPCKEDPWKMKGRIYEIQ